MWFLLIYNMESSWETRNYLNKHINNIVAVTRALKRSAWCHKSLMRVICSFQLSWASDTWPEICRISGNEPKAMRKGECFRQVDYVQKPCWVGVWIGQGPEGEGIRVWCEARWSGAEVICFGQWNICQHFANRGLKMPVSLGLLLLIALGHGQENMLPKEDASCSTKPNHPCHPNKGLR